MSRKPKPTYDLQVWTIDGHWVGLDAGQRVIGAHPSDPEWLDGIDNCSRRIRVRRSSIIRVLDTRENENSGDHDDGR